MAAPAPADEILVWPKTLCLDPTKMPGPEPVDGAESDPFAARDLGYRDVPGAAAFIEGSGFSSGLWGWFSSRLYSRLHGDPLQRTAS